MEGIDGRTPDKPFSYRAGWQNLPPPTRSAGCGMAVSDVGATLFSREHRVLPGVPIFDRRHCRHIPDLLRGVAALGDTRRAQPPREILHAGEHSAQD